jgi:hypothetical protein
MATRGTSPPLDEPYSKLWFSTTRDLVGNDQDEPLESSKPNVTSSHDPAAAASNHFDSSNKKLSSKSSVPKLPHPGVLDSNSIYSEKTSPTASIIVQPELQTRYLPGVSARNPFDDSEKPSLASSLAGDPDVQISSAILEGSYVPSQVGRGKYKFKSYRLNGNYEQPWRDDPRMKRTRINNWIVRGFMLIGVLVSAYICFSATKTVGKHPVSVSYPSL